MTGSPDVIKALQAAVEANKRPPTASEIQDYRQKNGGADVPDEVGSIVADAIGYAKGRVPHSAACWRDAGLYHSMPRMHCRPDGGLGSSRDRERSRALCLVQ